MMPLKPRQRSLRAPPADGVRGFGLLELMLVIALMGILATVGMSAYHLRLQQRQLQKTSIQMQQILQAGMAYYVDQKQWPETLQAQDFAPYLPEALLNGSNPWQQPYRLVHPNGHRLGVSTALPDEALAQRLAASLPNAVVKALTGTAVVIADVAVPGQASAAKGGVQVIAMGEWQGVTDGQRKTLVNLHCSGTLKLWPSLKAFRPKIENLVGGDPISKLQMNTACTEDSCRMTLINQHQINFGKPKPNGQVDIGYLVLCHHDQREQHYAYTIPQ